MEKILMMKNELFTASTAAMCAVGHRRLTVRESSWISALTKNTVHHAPELCTALMHEAREIGARSLAIMMAVEMVKSGVLSEDEQCEVVSSIMLHPDDLADFVTYWTNNYGRNMPRPVKRSLANSAEKLVQRYIVSNYDGSEIDLDMMIELCHPASPQKWQKDVESAAKNRRIEGISEELSRRLLYVRTWKGRRRGLATVELMEEIGVTWKWIRKWVGAMDSELWSMVLPLMTFHDILDNLGEISAAGVSPADRERIRAVITDRAQIEAWKITPYRILSAASRGTSAPEWFLALDQAMGLSAVAMPGLTATTTILIPGATHLRARVFAAAVAMRNEGRAVLARGRHGGSVRPVALGGDLSLMKTARAVLLAPTGKPQDFDAPQVIVIDGPGNLPDQIPGATRAYAVDWTARPGKVSLRGNTFHISGTPHKLFEAMSLMERYDTERGILA